MSLSHRSLTGQRSTRFHSHPGTAGQSTDMHDTHPYTCRPSSARAVPDCELEEELDEERYADLAHAQEVDTAASPTASAGI